MHRSPPVDQVARQRRKRDRELGERLEKRRIDRFDDPEIITLAFEEPEDTQGYLVVLDGVTFTVEPGTAAVAVGPNGSGKTTLLNCLSGLDDIDAGTVRFDGVVLHDMADGDRTRQRARSMGFIFQAFNLIPTLTAEEKAGEVSSAWATWWSRPIT